ncbi:hypothetical protein [Streptomyces zaomyceticus]|uniref:hypothetical protein n=1 Tax=Streptomyces zaomyceticus TaxID=68286 RepID=UPI0036979FF9
MREPERDLPSSGTVEQQTATVAAPRHQMRRMRHHPHLDKKARMTREIEVGRLLSDHPNAMPVWDASGDAGALDTEPRVKGLASAQVGDEDVQYGALEPAALFGGEAVEVGCEAGEGLEGGRGGLLRAARRSPRPVGRGRLVLVRGRALAI